jgi:cellulose synthase/poly-beta-1,6-N-acetylglucosamine synthase-like glycosyltransferase
MGRMPDPKLTVLTTVFNGERYLNEAIKSILAQDFTDYEYLIVDDGSTDNTPQILRRWAERDPRIVVERIAQNGGIARALNRGLALARGKYVGRQDADDVCVGPRLRRLVDQLESEPDVVLVSANFTMIDAQGAWAGNWVVENPSVVIAYLLNFSNAAAGAGGQGMFRRDMARELGGFREGFDVSEDYEFWTRLVQRGRIVILPFVGLKYRLHSQRSSVQQGDLLRRNSLANSLRMLTTYLDRTPSDEEFTAVVSIWRQEGRTGVAFAGHRLLSEAYARFATEADPQHRRRVRRITARQWFLSSVTLVRLSAFAEATRHLGYALAWHPFGVGDGIALLAERVLVRFRRMVRTVLS